MAEWWRGCLLAVACAVLTASACETAAQPQDEPSAHVPGDVYEVRTLGSWREGDRAGRFRVVTLRGGFDHVQTIVVVQWMHQAIGAATPEVVAERWIDPAEDLGPVAVDDVRAVTASDGLHLVIHIESLVSDEAGDLEVFAHAPGELTASMVPSSR